ncbi:EAL domain-containing protein [Micromonospora krabiensis]|uniref:EAL domain, c-di-GMP-specific phosphodiesterase class I (Or its enzymatically inactive variant) n=1 Tax=Micromonospora krabiensis TaxID=307121 RepID=A0A1C3N4G2_9ACTN|nr:bifunctional diguanylate cyclase/phosphodiesterase [Micromonospora krabiensis]SBV27458.1 EAL domain, c-di-GMP-specific phosphodiesterase class I (or its enzymatically inactive variant) [Micromonospora krabiensis]
MPLAAPYRAPARSVVPEAAVLVAGALLVLAGTTGLLSAPVVVALAVGAAATLAGVRLSRLAVRPPTPAGPAPAAPPEPGESTWPGAVGTRVARRAWTSTRAAVLLLDAGVVAAGVAAAALPLLDPVPPAVAVAAPTVVVVCAAAGLRRLPGGPHPPVRARLRGLADGIGPAAALVLAGWLLLHRSGVPFPARLAVALLLGVLGTVALTALTGAHPRAGAAVGRGGVALVLSGLVLLLLFPPASVGWPGLLAVPPLVVGLLLVAAGATRAATGRGPARPAPRWPRAVVPAVVLPLAAGGDLGSGLPPDRTTLLLALAAVPPLVLRELLRTADRSAPTRPAAHRRDPRSASVPATPPAHPSPASATSGLVDRSALRRVLAVRAEEAGPGGALLVVDLHVSSGDGGTRTLDDDLLAEALHRTRAVVGPRDLLATLDGAGFAVITTGGPMLAYALGTRLLATLTQPYLLGATAHRVQASIGLAELDGSGPDDVLRQADLARRRAVQLGRDRVEWYDAFLEEQLVRRLDLERELPGAVARGELDLVYQPVLGLADRSPVGAEALLRWRSPVLGTVLPNEFLPVAEDLDIVGELEWWVLDRACRQLAEWSAESRQLWMAVNVTTTELTTPDFVLRTAAVLAAYGVPADRLVVEVAEPRIGPELSTVVARLAGLRSLGVRTALDDFRAEHASLAQLRRLPIDLLKVGADLVDGAPDAPRPLLDVVVNVGDRLGVEVVAEELESPGQVEGAHRAGCRYGQGFALARPATAERVEAYLEEFPSASR